MLHFTDAILKHFWSSKHSSALIALIALDSDVQCLRILLRFGKFSASTEKQQRSLFPQHICDADLVHCTQPQCWAPVLKLHVPCEKSAKKCVKCPDGGEKINRTSVWTVDVMSQMRHLKRDLTPFYNMVHSPRPQHSLSRHFPNCITFKGYCSGRVVFKVVVSGFDFRE